MRKTWSSVVGVIAVAAILFGINLLADTYLVNARLDLTQQHVYTLSPGSKRILANIKEPITLRLFYSRALGAQVPVYGAYADRVREILRDYASLSHGKIKLEFFDPEPFSSTEDRAMGYGLQGVPMDRTGTQVYFGLAGTNLLDDQRTVPFFQPDRERFLEYDLTRLVYELSNPKKSVVGVMTSLPMDGNPQLMMMRRPGGDPWVSMLQLRQTFSVKTVPLDTQLIDPDIQVLLVVQPQHYSDNTLYAIDQFVMRGGRLLVAVDPHSEAEAAQPDPSGVPRTDTSSDLKKLFDAWGITFDPTHVVGDLAGAWRVRTNNPNDRVQVVDYVPWFNITEAGIAHDDPAMADVTQVTVASAGVLGKKDGTSIEFTPLLRSSAQSGLIPVDQVSMMPNPAKILADFKPEGGPRTIAARVRGVLKSAFTAAPPPPQGKKAPDNMPAFKAQTDGPANLVVFGDTDWLADRFWVRIQDFFGQQQATPFSDNGALFANLVGTLAGGDDLIGLRGRGASLRPFDMVDNMQRKAEAQYRRTEQELQKHLEDTQKKLADLRAGNSDTGKGAGKAVLTAEQEAAIAGLQTDIVATRAKLRGVQLELRRDIDRLEAWLRIADIVAVPALLTVLAIVLGIARSRRRAKAHV
jgi:ABC-type uncharacterized transport system involved in gliding motility auxiliary subunit